MKLPDCYDAVFQEERRQQNWDRWLQRFPVCGCCGRTLRGGEVFFQLDSRKETLIVCEECKAQMEENVCYVEELVFA